MKFASKLFATSLSITMLCGVGIAQAESYPSKPIHLILGFPPGGSTDLVARTLAQKLTPMLGQQVIVENRPGAGGNIGEDAVAKAAPDGYTLFLASIGHVINPSLYRKLPFNAEKDFTPVALAVTMPDILVVNPGVPAHNVKELINLGKKEPGQLKFASSGNGTSLHLALEMFNQMTGTKITHVPYKGNSPAEVDLLGGRVQGIFDNLSPALPYIKSGKIRALAVTTKTRWPELPNVPTVAEAGVPGFDVTAWFGVLAPAGTPKNIVEKLNKDINIILKQPDTRTRMISLGALPAGGTPEQFNAFIHTEMAKWAKIVKASGAHID